VEGLTGLPAHRLARMLRAREVSAAELLAAHLDRLEAVNPLVNAVVRLAPDAMDRARAADQALAGGEQPGPLHGVPFTAKDNFETRGVVTAIGVPGRAGTVPQADATAVARMRAAGGIPLGKTNCPPWGGGLETDNPLDGRTDNPDDRARTPGGSSGGEAAAVAAALSPCGLGTDSVGSLRVPAHFCGVATLKPTSGLVPVTGVIDDDGPIGALSDPRTQPGPVARSVADLTLLLGVLAGPDGRDGGVAPVPPGDPAAVRVEGLRMAVHTGAGSPGPTPETTATVTAAAEALASAGAAVEEARPPGDGHASPSRSGVPTAPGWAARSSTGSCAAGTATGPSWAPGWPAGTRSSPGATTSPWPSPPTWRPPSAAGAPHRCSYQPSSSRRSSSMPK